MMEMKLCPRCKETKDATLDYFGISKQTSSGLTVWCKTCINQYAKDRYTSKKTGKSNKPKPIYKKRSNLLVPIPPKEVEIVPISRINMFKGHSYSIQVPRNGKGTEGRLFKGTVIQVTDEFIALQTKNYIESFSMWELSKYKIMEV